MAEEESPLIKALPPESDYLTYLTIIEYNLSPESLPILHRVLQDETLTTNIGWDLVHLLVPHLPDSQPCLHDIARLGNPREVILKVTESLRLIEYQEEDADEEDDAVQAGASDAPLAAGSSTYPLKTEPVSTGPARVGSSQAVELPPPLPLATSQFIALLSMLAILHTRIKAKNPSRFLSSTLQAILASFSNSVSHREEMILAIIKTIKAITGTKRPALPNRQSSGMFKSDELLKTDAPAGDPEALADSQVTVDEKATQTKLLQSFVTHIVEEYLLNLSYVEQDVPGMAWCSRIMEKVHPERVIPDTETFAVKFTNSEKLQRRIDSIGQLVSLAKDLKITDYELLDAAITVEKAPSQPDLDEDEPPSSADEIPFSRLGSLMLYAARQVSNIVYDAPELGGSPPFVIFPNHQEILKHCLSSAEQGTGTLGTEPEALIDSVLALGLITLERDDVGEPSSDEQFNEYLQLTALLSSNCPSGNLRGHAHYLTSTILRSQPNENVRLAFIRDTLEHCPFENLKVSAVGWIKGETIEANAPTPLPGHPDPQDTATTADQETSIFATPLALDSLAPFLFPALQADLLTPTVQESWLTFRLNFSFYLASLNFLYLLLNAKQLHNVLAIPEMWTNNDVPGSFLQPLREASAMFQKGLDAGGGIAEERSDEVLAELNVLNEALERVTGAVKLLNE